MGATVCGGPPGRESPRDPVRRERVRQPARRGLRALRRARARAPPACGWTGTVSSRRGAAPGRTRWSGIERCSRLARDAGLSIWACLHHFTLPGWFADDLHGFRDDKSGRLVWSRHVDWVAETFGDLVAGWKPINEPTFYALGGHLFGAIPPGHRDRSEATDVLRTIHRAGAEAARLLRTPATPAATVEALLPIFKVEDTAEEHRRRRAAGRRCGGTPGPTTSSSTPTTTSASPTTPPSACAATGRRALAGGRPPGPQGYVRWAEGFAHVLDRLSVDHPGPAAPRREAGIGTDDEPAAERLRRRGPRHGRARPSPAGSTCAGSSGGPASTTTSGATASTCASASSTETATPSPPPPRSPRSVDAEHRMAVASGTDLGGLRAWRGRWRGSRLRPC